MRWLAALLALALAAPASATPEPIASVEVVRDGARWSAEYRIGVRAPVAVFAKSVLPRESRKSWRLETVRVLTPGVKLERLGHYDALVATRGYLPPRVRLAFTPYHRDIEAGYDPAIALGPDAVALYADAFKIVPMSSRRAALAADRDDGALPASAKPTRMTFRDRAGPLLFKGQRVARATTDNGETYVIFGKASPVIGPALTTIVDPGLPRWIATYLTTEMPTILASYRQAMGPAPVGQPTLLLSWGGPTPQRLSLGGSVLPGLVTMTFEGDTALTYNERIRNHARWFVAHEAAHFWLGQAIGYSTPAESWITEGGADLLAFRATAAADPRFDVRARLAEARDECAPFLKNGGVADAYRREGDFRAYYACGTLIALAAEKANAGDFAGFIKTLIARHGATGIVSRADWLKLVEEKAPGRGYGAAIADLLDKPHADPGAAIDRYIAAVGLSNQIAPRKAA